MVEKFVPWKEDYFHCCWAALPCCLHRLSSYASSALHFSCRRRWHSSCCGWERKWHKLSALWSECLYSIFLKNVSEVSWGIEDWSGRCLSLSAVLDILKFFSVLQFNVIKVCVNVYHYYIYLVTKWWRVLSSSVCKYDNLNICPSFHRVIYNGSVVPLVIG